MGSGIPCLAGRFINDSLNVRRAKRRAAALTRLSTLELAPVLRFAHSLHAQHVQSQRRCEFQSGEGVGICVSTCPPLRAFFCNTLHKFFYFLFTFAFLKKVIHTYDAKIHYSHASMQ